MKKLSLLILLTLAACASVKPKPIDFHVNVGEDIRAVEDEIKASRDGVMALLAPAEIDRAELHVKRATEGRRMNERRDDVLRELGLAHAYLDLATEKATPRMAEMDEVFAQRRAALAAGARRLDETRGAFNKLDEMIAKSHPATEKRRARLTRAYRLLEVTGVEAHELGEARAQLMDARRLRANLIAPESLGAAERAYFSAADAIANSPRAPESFREQVDLARNLARALVAITAQARAVAARSDEDIARELLLSRQKVEQLTSELAGVELNSAVKSQRLKDAVERNEFNAVLERARNGLANADAEVYPAGDRLLIRLKSGGSNTLQSVKGVLKELKAHDVVVQGGSTGQASEVAKSLSEVGPVARTVDPGADAQTPVEVVLTPETQTHPVQKR